jgi:phage terminase large subunit
MDKPSKILSTEYDLVYVQEATELTLEDWETLTTRIRNGVVGFQQLVADCNPAEAEHWLLARCNSGSTRMLLSLHSDNPRLYDDDGQLTEYGAAYMSRLEALTGVRRLRLLDGKWVSAEGQIYETFDKAVHEVEAMPVGWESWSRVWGVDWGFTNPAVVGMFAEDPDGRLWLYREFYHTGLLVSDLAQQVMDVVAPDGEWLEPRPRLVVADHDPEAQEQFRQGTGLAVVDAVKDVKAGIEKVQQRLRTAGDGKPRLFFVKDALVRRDASLVERWLPACTVEEVGGYVWSDKKQDTPVKENDHGLDTVRYVVMGVDNVVTPSFRWVS